MTTASDDFNRANESPVASPWTTMLGGGAILSSNVLTSESAVDRRSFYSGTWGNDQEASAVVGGLSSGDQYACLIVRANATSGGNAFEIQTDGVSGSGHTSFGKWTNGAFSELGAIATTVANGDTLRLTVSGSSGSIVLTAYKNGGQVGQLTGQTGNNSGNPGAGAFGQLATVDTWSATDNASGSSISVLRYLDRQRRR